MKKRKVISIYSIIIIVVAFLFIALIFKVSLVALSSEVDGIDLKKFADNRNTKTETLYASRGDIYDIHGEVLASTVNSYTLIAYLDPSRTTNPKRPNHVVDKENTARILSEYLNLEYDYILKRLNQDKYQVEFGPKGSNLSETLKNKIEEERLSGISFIEGKQRNYKNSSFASYIIGYASTKDDVIKGELGIEAYYNEELSGKDGSKTYQTDAYGYELPNANVAINDAIDGSDIYLTIDSNLQYIAENTVQEFIKEYEMDWMVFTVMDAKSGAILASSTYPNFNPNDLNTIKSYMNPLVSYEYEPGSTMKIFSFASSIEEGIYDGEKEYSSGKLPVGNVVISDFNEGAGWGKISYDTGFAYSSNVAASLLAFELGADKLTDYYKTLGFGSKTGIELANEVKGKINIRYKSELATASFGQGITVTPIQMLKSLTTIVNDGELLKPYIVDKIVNHKGKVVYEGERQSLGKVYSKETTDYMKELMYDVVYNGLSTYWRPEKTTLAGKTGTAQIAGAKGYLDGKYDYIKSFAGIFPYENPEYVVYMAIKRINTGTSNIANKLTKSVDSMVSYLGIVNKDEESTTNVYKLDNYISKKTNDIINDLNQKFTNVIIVGNGEYITDTYPKYNSKLTSRTKVFLKTNSDEILLPNFTGWNYSDIINYKKLSNLNIKINGYGYVSNQSIPENTLVTKDDVIEVDLNT